jgi:hypothetical protein
MNKKEGGKDICSPTTFILPLYARNPAFEGDLYKIWMVNSYCKSENTGVMAYLT